MSKRRDLLNKAYNERMEKIDKDLSLKRDKLLKPKNNQGTTEMIKVSNTSFLKFLNFIIASSSKTDKYSDHVIPIKCNESHILNPYSKDIIVINVRRIYFENCDLNIRSKEIASLLNKKDCVLSILFTDCVFVNCTIKFDNILSSYSSPKDLVFRCRNNLSRLKYKCKPDMDIDTYNNFEVEEIKLDKKLTSCCFVNSKINSINSEPLTFFNKINYYRCIENIGNLNSDKIYKKNVKYGYKLVKANLTNPTKKMMVNNYFPSIKGDLLFLPILLKVKIPEDAQVVEPIFQSCDSYSKLRASKLVPVEASIICTDSNRHTKLIPIKSKYIKAKYIKKCIIGSSEFDKVFEFKYYTGKFESLYGDNFYYRLNEEITPDVFDNDLINQCSYGLHFFKNKEGTIEYYFASMGAGRCLITLTEMNYRLMEQIVIEDKNKEN